MLFSEFKVARMAELMREEWGSIRIPDLLETYAAAARPRRVLETGCYRGVSTEFWALHCAEVVAIDPFVHEQARRDFFARVSHYPHVEVIPGYSPIELFGDYKFDLVYLDGDHSYDTVMREIAAYRSSIVPGGFIGGHDYTATPTPGDGVKRAVDEIFGGPTFVGSDNSWLVRID